MFLEEGSLRHVSQQHLDRDEVDEDGPLVAPGLDVAPLEGVGQVLLGRLEVDVGRESKLHIYMQQSKINGFL